MPLRRWVDHIARTRREQEEQALISSELQTGEGNGVEGHPSAATPSGSPGRPSFLSSRVSSWALSTRATPPGIKSSGSTSLAPPPSSDCTAGQCSATRPYSPSGGAQSKPSSAVELAAFLARIPNFQRYPPPFDLTTSPNSTHASSLFSSNLASGRRLTADAVKALSTDGYLPGAYPDSTPHRLYSSPGIFDSLGDDEAEEARKAEQQLATADAQACAGRRAVLAMSVWWAVGSEGSEGRVEYVEGEWALPAKFSSPPTMPASGTDTSPEPASVDGLPTRQSTDEMPPLPGKPSASGCDPAADHKAHGDLLYGLSDLDPSLDPETHHLFGGTLAVTLPKRQARPILANQGQRSTSPSLSTSLELPLYEILRIALYSHVAALLEIALLDAHGRPPAPPPSQPSLFRAFFDKTASVRSMVTQAKAEDSKISSQEPSHTEMRDGSVESLWKRRRAKLSRTWGGLLSALGGSSDGGSTSSCTTGEWEGIRPSQPRRLFPSDSTVVVDVPPSSTISMSVPQSGLSLSPPVKPTSPSAAHSMEEAAAPLAMEFSRNVAAMQKRIFSTSPSVVFPPPPLLVRLRGSIVLPRGAGRLTELPSFSRLL